MMLDFFNRIFECQHEKVFPDSEGAYCPDCGLYVENKWFLVRCSCCSVKRTAISKFNIVKPTTNYCPNCGSDEFYLEQIDNINFVDVYFAVHKKVTVPTPEVVSKSQVWVNEKENTPQKFLGVLRV